MAEMKGADIIYNLRKKWIVYAILSDLFFSIGLAFLFSVSLNKLTGITLWSLPITLLTIFPLLLFIRHSWKIKEITIAQLLNQYYPELQESSGLLLKEPASLNILEQLQRHRTEEALSGIPAPLSPVKKLNHSLSALAIMLTAGFILYQFPFHFKHILPVTDSDLIKDSRAIEKILPAISDALITISPPSYTGLPARKQAALPLTIEEGSLVTWQLNTPVAASGMKFIFNDSLTVAGNPTNTSHRSWRFDRKLSSPGFYQVAVDDNLSELYKIETIRDQAPVIQIQSPGQYTAMGPGQSPKVLTRVAISDDYGIQNAYISATISSGNGEAVKFKEQQIALPGFNPGKTGYQLQKILSLPELGMQPGDELYFFVRAIDNHQQETRSDMYIINLPDTAGLMSLEGLANGMTILPSYFRSQRQIIIETEQLLKVKDSISITAFNNRSAGLGMDQKMLRLRYGRFLGEEDESGEIAGENRLELQDPANFSNAEKIKEVFMDQHDKAEDATFFEPGTKKQLKATLTEMWNAELPLRTFKPREALPFEYKALRLLKDLQQKTRAYVAKTNLKTTPLDLQKRLRGDLSKIIQPRFQKDLTQKENPQLVLREALGILERLKTPGSLTDSNRLLLHRAGLQLNDYAIAQPSVYLPAVEAMRRITNALETGSAILLNDINEVERSFQKILPAPGNLPSAGNTDIKQPLSKQYFINLQHKR